MIRVKDNEIILKASKEKYLVMNKGNPIRLPVYF